MGEVEFDPLFIWVWIKWHILLGKYSVLCSTESFYSSAFGWA